MTKPSRGHRDTLTVLLTYRHGLRAVEVVDLPGSRSTLKRRPCTSAGVKNGTPSTHPLTGRELRGLIARIGRGRFSRTVAGGVKVPPSLQAPARSLPLNRRWAGTFCSRFPALTMTTFVLIVTFAVAGVTDGVRTERIGRFDSYQSCVAAGHAMYPRQKCQCVPESR
jgi:hypothetical protein